MNAVSIITFKWKKTNSGYRLKSPVDYSSTHVNILFNSIKRNTTVPFKFYCITDDFTGLDEEINKIQLWETYKHLGGCYNRLYIFSDEVRKLFGDKIVSIDLDCVIVGNIDSILSKDEDFVINKFVGKVNHNQLYNGGLILFKTGKRKQLWNNFEEDQVSKIDKIREEKHLVGSDQAWIQICLGENESVFDENDGVYDYSFLKENQLPENAKIILFPGKVDPATEILKVDWISKYWR